MISLQVIMNILSEFVDDLFLLTHIICNTIRYWYLCLSVVCCNPRAVSMLQYSGAVGIADGHNMVITGSHGLKYNTQYDIIVSHLFFYSHNCS